MRLALAGVNHSTAPVELREKLAFRLEEIPEALRAIQAKGAREALILSTCNRVEIAAALDDDAAPDLLVEGIVGDRRGIVADQVWPHLYLFEQREAIRHVFRVASSLDSMIVGEPQILGQLKQAMRQARDHGAIGSLLDAVLRGAFAAAKRVRTETEIGQNAVSVSYAAVELAREIFGSLNKKRVLIVGAGKMSEGAVRHLVSAGVAQILIANRTPERADDLARLFQGQAVAFDALPQRLPEVDIVIASAAAPGYILTRDLVRRAIEQRKNQPMFLIDIAVPRNIEPEVNDLEHAFLYDMDDLQRLTERNREGRRQSAEQAESILDEEVARLEARLRERDLVPTIVGLQDQLEAIRREVLERYRSRMGLLTPDQEEMLDALTRSLIGKIAHGPISEIRRHAAAYTGDPAHGSEVVSAVRRMFKLDVE